MTRQKERNKDSVTKETPLKPAGEVQLIPTKKASEQPPEKRIHPRRPLPMVPEKSPKDEK
jgi:hypothetical protein